MGSGLAKFVVQGGAALLALVPRLAADPTNDHLETHAGNLKAAPSEARTHSTRGVFGIDSIEHPTPPRR